jgi:hypothetical protein
VSDIDIKASDDILDAANNETAHHFDEMMQASGKARKEALIAKMQQPSSPPTPKDTPQDYWFMHQQAPQNLPPDQAMFDQNIVQPVTNQENESYLHDPEPQLSAEEQAIIEKAKREKETTQSQYNSHHKVILTPEQQRVIDEKNMQQEKEKKELETSHALEEKQKGAEQQKTQLSNTDKMNLVESGFKLDTISSLAKHKVEEKKDDGEVVIKLR